MKSYREIPIDRDNLPTPADLEREETVFDRDIIDRPERWDVMRKTAKAWAKVAGYKSPRYQDRLENGDKWYPYVLATSKESRLRVCGWNEMVEVWAEDEWKTLVPPQHEGAHWRGGGSAMYFSNGEFKFQTHGGKERKGSCDYPVIEDMAGDKAKVLFPDRYVRLSDGREGISTEGLSPGDLKSVMRDLNLVPYEPGGSYAKVGRGVIEERKAEVRRKLEDMGCNPNLGWEQI